MMKLHTKKINEMKLMPLSFLTHPLCSSDYRFLEDTTRLAGSSSRDDLIRTPTMTFKVSVRVLT